MIFPTFGLTRLVKLSLIVSLLFFLPLMVLAQDESPAGGDDYFVQAADWLSKLADRYYGDPLAYPAIVEATNTRAAEDDSYAVITNADVIEIGQKLYIPSPEEAAEILGRQASEFSAASPGGSLVIYSGRSESLVGPLLEMFTADTGINVEVRYGSTSGMAATILEEGNNSPADIYYGQDAGALGALSNAGRFATLSEDILNTVDARYQASNGTWVGISGRARVVVYNTTSLTEADLPADIFGFCDSAWQGRLGWAPTNGSFQAFVTALRVIEGEDRARQWLECIQANQPVVYSGNTPIVEAVGAGEIDAGFVNHYYLYRFLAENPDFPARNYYPRSGDVGAMVNVAGVGILNSASNVAQAQIFVDYLLSQKAQSYFNQETNEYTLANDVIIETNALLTPLGELSTPNIDLNRLEDLPGTLDLLTELGIL